MGADHSHSHHHRTAPAPPGAVRAMLAVIVPLAVATLAALIWMWPDGNAPASAEQAPEPVKMTRVTGTVTAIAYKDCAQAGEFEGDWLTPTPAPGRRCGDATVRLTSGPQEGGTVKVALPTGPGSLEYSVGDKVVLLHMPSGADGGGGQYQLTDHDRTNGMWLVGAAFALAVIAFGRWRGVTALVGLTITFVLLVKFLIPAILEGRPPLLVAIVGSAAIMLAVLYLTHGVTMATSIAVVGTLASLALTGVLASAAIGLTHLSGLADESSLNLGLSYDLNLQGLLLAGIIIGSLGVLDDITITQAATVGELARANPAYGFGRLYRAAARVGRAHIASVINTIILAYAGSSLPLLILISVGEQPLGQVLTGQVLAEEIVRSVAGTLGLIAAVPVTTALAAVISSRSVPASHEEHEGPHEETSTGPHDRTAGGPQGDRRDRPHDGPPEEPPRGRHARRHGEEHDGRHEGPYDVPYERPGRYDRRDDGRHERHERNERYAPFPPRPRPPVEDAELPPPGWPYTDRRE
ncbi:YibE/F family protein [Thermomonospora catenispora]|uniref:YibE/F family protein n=1 Tax=Thermomonospora catenispora TaxID=2493090 RepID=UPI001F4F4FDA|nr:YibE/F family protein [Thermomonospora catenispora]